MMIRSIAVRTRACLSAQLGKISKPAHNHAFPIASNSAQLKVKARSGDGPIRESILRNLRRPDKAPPICDVLRHKMSWAASKYGEIATFRNPEADFFDGNSLPLIEPLLLVDYNRLNTAATPLLLHAQPWRSFFLGRRF